MGANTSFTVYAAELDTMGMAREMVRTRVLWAETVDNEVTIFADSQRVPSWRHKGIWLIIPVDSCWGRYIIMRRATEHQFALDHQLFPISLH